MCRVLGNAHAHIHISCAYTDMPIQWKCEACVCEYEFKCANCCSMHFSMLTALYDMLAISVYEMNMEVSQRDEH